MIDSPIAVELHDFDGFYDITRWVKSVRWTESVRSPWDSTSVELVMPLRRVARVVSRRTEQVIAEYDNEVINDTGKVRVALPASPGVWLKVRDYATGRTHAIARIGQRPLNLGAGSRGTIGNRVSLRASGMFSFIRSLPVEMVPALREDLGGIMSFGGAGAKRLYALFQRLVSGPDPSMLVGPDGLFACIAPVQIPNTLVDGVSTVADFFRVAWGPGDAGAAAPLRVMSRVPLSETAALAHIFPQGTALDVALSIFQREPRLIEMFPSIEGSTNNPREAGYADARPAIVHRIAPWVTDKLSEMVVDEGGATEVKIDPVWDEPTWRLERALKLAPNQGFRLSTTRSDDARINVVTVNWSVAGGSPARWLLPAGLPIGDKQDADRHGARLLELNWDLPAGVRRARASSRGVADESAIVRTIRTVGWLGWHFYGLGHVFETGTIDTRFLGPLARPGEIVSADYGGKVPFTAYMTSVTHSAERRDRGVMTARTSIEFDRGLWDERMRDPHVYRRSVTVTAPASPPKPEPTPAPAPASATSYVKFGGRQVPWMSTEVALEQRLSSSPSAYRARRDESSAIDIAVVHFTGGRALSIDKAIATFDSHGGDGIHFIIDPAGKVYQYMDLRLVASHADDNDVNIRSVGIEVMSPGFAHWKASAALLPAGPWKKLTGFWYNNLENRKSYHFHGASEAQEKSLAVLLAFLRANFAVSLVAPAADRVNPKRLRVPSVGNRCDVPIAEGGLGIPVSTGVWHHVEIKNPYEGRIDALGIILPDVLDVARGFVTAMTEPAS